MGLKVGLSPLEESVYIFMLPETTGWREHLDHKKYDEAEDKCLMRCPKIFNLHQYYNN
jgi:hypothetical protein